MMIASSGSNAPPLLQRTWFLVALVVIATLVSVGLVQPVVLIGLLFDGLAATLIVIPATLAGFLLIPFLRLGELPFRWQLLLAATLGLGFLSTLLLVCGLLGILQRPVWIGILVAGAVIGYVRMRSSLVAQPSAISTTECGLQPFHYLWLLAVPFLVLGILAASNPPGFIWREEGFGYDVLEYHLQVPREYLQLGSVTYLPHNVYANLSANVEMFYMLAMILLDDTRDVGTTANMIHLILGTLTVYAAWVAGREYSRRAGVIGGVAMATTGWLVYLSGLAYVENGMLFFGMTALAAALRFLKSPEKLGWLIVAGLTAGFSCGCKLTAVPMIAVPVALFICFGTVGRLQRRATNVLYFIVASAAALSPWLIKNIALTGNPVFPLANGWFHAVPAGWSDDDTAAWNRGHAPPALDAKGIERRLKSLWYLIGIDRYQRIGFGLILLGLGGLWSRTRSRVDALLITTLLFQLFIWLFATHLLLRFAVVITIPLTLLSARSLGDATATPRGTIIGALLAIAAAWNATYAIRLNRAESTNGAPASLIYEGRLQGLEYMQVVNQELPHDAKILLVGDARAFNYQRNVDYCVAFNRNPFFERLTSGATDNEIVNWLEKRGYTHLLIHWNEVRRLSSTYGFSPPMDETQLANRMAGLTQHGVHLLREFPREGQGKRYVTLYSVSRKGQ